LEAGKTAKISHVVKATFVISGTKEEVEAEIAAISKGFAAKYGIADQLSAGSVTMKITVTDGIPGGYSKTYEIKSVSRRRLNDGLIVTVEVDFGEGEDAAAAADAASELISGDTSEEALTAILQSGGSTLTAVGGMQIERTVNTTIVDAGLSDAALAGIIVGVMIAVILGLVMFCKFKKIGPFKAKGQYDKAVVPA
jgi:hypothetical protein